MSVKGVANATEVERLEFELAGVTYWVEIFKDPPARVWNAIRTPKPGESPFDQDTRLLETTVQAWDLGLDISREAIEDLTDPVRGAMLHVVSQYYVELQNKHQDLLARIYRPGGDGPTDPSSGSATASGSRAPSRGSRRTR